MIVIQDSLDHRMGNLSVKMGGSANGHNGVKSIISSLGGRVDFHRFRIGIGRDQTDPAQYVLQKMSSHERTYWGVDGEGIDLILREAEKISRKL
jgi:PTH1 family peptidyl-tRNA hydrolase